MAILTDITVPKCAISQSNAPWDIPRDVQPAFKPLTLFKTKTAIFLTLFMKRNLRCPI